MGHHGMISLGAHDQMIYFFYLAHLLSDGGDQLLGDLFLLLRTLDWESPTEWSMDGKQSFDLFGKVVSRVPELSAHNLLR
jgi:hypothetical protein